MVAKAWSPCTGVGEPWQPHKALDAGPAPSHCHGSPRGEGKDVNKRLGQTHEEQERLLDVGQKGLLMQAGASQSLCRAVPVLHWSCLP